MPGTLDCEEDDDARRSGAPGSARHQSGRPEAAGVREGRGLLPATSYPRGESGIHGSHRLLRVVVAGSTSPTDPTSPTSQPPHPTSSPRRRRIRRSLGAKGQTFPEVRRGKLEGSAAWRLKVEESAPMRGNVDERKKSGAQRRRAGAERGDGDGEPE